MSYSHMGTPTLPSALLHFTSEFGMGSGGSTALLSLDKKLLIRKAVFIYRSILYSIYFVRDLHSYVYVRPQTHMDVANTSNRLQRFK